MTDQTPLNYRPFSALLLPEPWTAGRVVLLGDAVHSTTPHLASGAGIAVEDALVLAEELARETDVETALKAYSRRRFPRSREVVERSLAIGRHQLAGGDPREVGRMMGEALHVLAEPY
jgi:2-polyprenyl-6-methoxyphenol hydroxylase-like FAD-dependent oxidoreductase